MTDTQMQFFFFYPAWEDGRWNVFLWMWMIKIWTMTWSSQTYTPQCFIHWSTWEIGVGNIVAESWLCLHVVQGEKKKKEKHQRYNRMCSAWSRPLLPRWQCDSWQFDLDLERCPVLCVNVWFVCVYVHEHVLKCTYLYICKYVHIIIGLCFFCAGGMRENFLCAVV